MPNPLSDTDFDTQLNTLGHQCQSLITRLVAFGRELDILMSVGDIPDLDTSSLDDAIDWLTAHANTTT